MSLESVVLGILGGLTTGLLAVGLVLVYKAHRFINLAHASLGTLSTLVLAKLVINFHVSWWLAFPVATTVGVAVGLSVERLVIRRLRARTKNAVSLLLVTVGISQLLLALTFVPALQPDQTSLTFRGYPLPFEASIHVGNLILGTQYILILVLTPTLVLGLTAFLHFTVLGKTIRAAASNPDQASLCGISVSYVGAVSWAIAGGLAAVTAILQAPGQASFSLSALGPDLLLRALGAAALGGFVSVSGALIGGVLIGLAEHITLGITGDGNVAQLVVLAVILVILLVRGRVISEAMSPTGAPVDDLPTTRVPERLRSRWLVRHDRVALGAFGLGVAILVPLLPYFRPEGRRFLLVVTLVYAMVAVALTMLVGWAGQVSLGHFALVGVGAYLAARLLPHGWSLPALLLVAGTAGAGIMTIVGLPALRLRGMTLAITSLGFGVVAPSWLFRQDWFGSSNSIGIDVAPPTVLASLGRLEAQLPTYYVALAVLTLTATAAATLRHTGPGRLVVAVRDNERATASFGVTPATVKLGLLALTGFIAGASGVLFAVTWRHVGTSQFDPSLSLALLAIPVIGGLGSVSGAIAATAALYVPTFFIAPHLSGLLGQFGRQIGFQLALGGTALVLMQLRYPHGIAGAAQRTWEAALRRVDETQRRVADVGAAEPLVTNDIQLAFGGVRALNGASITVHHGEIVGLIGPNGAGKSTLLNVVTGVLHATSGTVQIFGEEVSGLPSEVRANFGLNRTFQAADLFPGLTVRETVQVALTHACRSGLVSAAVGAPWSRSLERSTTVRANEVLERLGMLEYADVRTRDLSTGMRRIGDLAAQMAAEPKLLLLDEPTGGVAQREAEAFGPLLRRIRDELGCAILIVEHDMPLLMGVCDRVYAMEAGDVIAEGTPEEIRRDPAVIAAYLGTDDVAVARSGSRSVDSSTPPARAPRRQPLTVAVTRPSSTKRTSRPVGGLK